MLKAYGQVKILDVESCGEFVENQKSIKHISQRHFCTWLEMYWRGERIQNFIIYVIFAEVWCESQPQNKKMGFCIWICGSNYWSRSHPCSKTKFQSWKNHIFKPKQQNSTGFPEATFWNIFTVKDHEFTEIILNSKNMYFLNLNNWSVQNSTQTFPEALFCNSLIF